MNFTRLNQSSDFYTFSQHGTAEISRFANTRLSEGSIHDIVHAVKTHTHTAILFLSSQIILQYEQSVMQDIIMLLLSRMIEVDKFCHDV